jgi:hypothetical protein
MDPNNFNLRLFSPSAGQAKVSVSLTNMQKYTAIKGKTEIILENPRFYTPRM